MEGVCTYRLLDNMFYDLEYRPPDWDYDSDRYDEDMVFKFVNFAYLPPNQRNLQ
jgi:hypothetical protein